MSNLRQIGVAISMYADDNNGYGPLAVGPINGGSYPWCVFLVPYTQRIQAMADVIFICPEKPVPLIISTAYVGGSRTYAVNPLVLGGAYSGGTYSGHMPIKLGDVRRPSDVILVADSNQVKDDNWSSEAWLQAYPFSLSTMPASVQVTDLVPPPSSAIEDNHDDPPAAAGGRVRYRHGEIANALMVDGHVEGILHGRLQFGNIFPQ